MPRVLQPQFGGNRYSYCSPAVSDSFEHLAMHGGVTGVRAHVVRLHLKQECTGHIVNRLQAALFREAVYLVQQGIATVRDIDRGVAFGPALRWPISGVFTTWHLAGGRGGVAEYMDKLAPSIELLWRNLGDAQLTQHTRAMIEQQVSDHCSGRSPEEMSAVRDRQLVEFAEWLKGSERLI